MDEGSDFCSTYPPPAALAQVRASPVGPVGLKGLKGAPGPPGTSGSPGDPGPPGDPGADSIIPGPPGNPGPQGPNGPAGQPGDQGYPGTQGNPGAKGPPGPPGAMGNSGPTGMNGLPGVRGLTGGAGAHGNQGTHGVQGQPGPPGASGPTQPSVYACLNGNSGTGTVFSTGVPVILAPNTFSIKLFGNYIADNGTSFTFSEPVLPPSSPHTGRVYAYRLVYSSPVTQLQPAVGVPAPVQVTSYGGSLQFSNGVDPPELFAFSVYRSVTIWEFPFQFTILHQFEIDFAASGGLPVDYNFTLTLMPGYVASITGEAVDSFAMLIELLTY